MAADTAEGTRIDAGSRGSNCDGRGLDYRANEQILLSPGTIP
jgi:hypothetical protein